MGKSYQDDSDDDDLNDEDIPGFGGVGTPLLATPDKGKARAPDSPAPSGLPPPVVSGNMHSSAGAPRGSTRQALGGLQVETR
jgi:hypothetical protein